MAAQEPDQPQEEAFAKQEEEEAQQETTQHAVAAGVAIQDSLAQASPRDAEVTVLVEEVIQPPELTQTNYLAKDAELSIPHFMLTPASNELKLLDTQQQQALLEPLQESETSLLFWFSMAIVLLLSGLMFLGNKELVALLVPQAALPKIPPPTAIQQARLLLTQGMDAYHVKDVSGAIASLQQAVQLDNQLPQAHYNLGVMYAMQKKEKEAAQHYQHYMALSANTTDANTQQSIKDIQIWLNAYAQQQAQFLQQEKKKQEKDQQDALLQKQNQTSQLGKNKTRRTPVLASKTKRSSSRKIAKHRAQASKP